MCCILINSGPHSISDSDPVIGCIIFIIIIIWSPLYEAGREGEHYISPKTPTPHNQPMEGKKR